MSNLLFSELNLSPEILKAVQEMGFETATKIQAGVIPPLLAKKDVVGQSETGSGKTAAFVIPLLERVDPRIRYPQALVLCPTRELAIQVAAECSRLMRYKRGISVLPVYGGQPIDRQIDMLRRGVHIVIATPGRLLDHLERKTISLQSVTMTVLDEADEMLDMGFSEDILAILEKIPGKPQMAFFSATIPPMIRTMIKQYMVDPQNVGITGKSLTVAATQQFYIDADFRQKTDILCRLIDVHSVQRGIVFCNMKKTVDDLVEQLQARGYLADALHGDLVQKMRDRVMASFRSGGVRLLIATDVAGRGIDVDDIDYVINYDLPQDEEDYVHRIGRTSRAGKSGTAISLVCGREIYKLKSIEHYARVKITRQRTPTFDEAQEIVTARMLESIRKTIAEGHLSPYIAMVENICGDDHTPMDAAAALLKIFAPIPQKPVHEPKRERVWSKEDRREHERTRRGAGRGRPHFNKDRDRDRNHKKKRFYGK
jgi:ATP-dependent RNA helicase DeaD